MKETLYNFYKESYEIVKESKDSFYALLECEHVLGATKLYLDLREKQGNLEKKEKEEVLNASLMVNYLIFYLKKKFEEEERKAFGF